MCCCEQNEIFSFFFFLFLLFLLSIIALFIFHSAFQVLDRKSRISRMFKHTHTYFFCLNRFSSALLPNKNHAAPEFSLPHNIVWVVWWTADPTMTSFFFFLEQVDFSSLEVNHCVEIWKKKTNNNPLLHLTRSSFFLTHFHTLKKRKKNVIF